MLQHLALGWQQSPAPAAATRAGSGAAPELTEPQTFAQTLALDASRAVPPGSPSVHPACLPAGPSILPAACRPAKPAQPALILWPPCIHICSTTLTDTQPAVLSLPAPKVVCTPCPQAPPAMLLPLHALGCRLCHQLRQHCQGLAYLGEQAGAWLDEPQVIRLCDAAGYDDCSIDGF